MEQFKIEHFERDNPGTPFPHVRSLSPDETRSLRARLRGLLQTEPGGDDLDLTRLVRAISVPLSEVNAEDSDFNLCECLLSRGVVAEAMVYVNWYRYDDVDELSLEELSRYFQYIWYPAADDIEVFDQSCSWIASIGHSGDVALSRLLE